MDLKRQHFDLRVGEVLVVGGSRITVQAKTGQRTRLLVESNEPTRRGDALQHPNTSPPATTLKRPGS